ncbi:MAG: acyltransferase [Acidobacteriota bacterium]
MPWPVRRILLAKVLGYEIHRTARIGYSVVCPVRLKMGAGSRIGHFTVCKAGVELLRMGDHAILGNLNWVTGSPLNDAVHFKGDSARRSELLIDDHASVTTRHFIDCTATVSIGMFSVFAGCRSTILSHSVDLSNCEQSCNPVSIGRYCFVGTASVLLPGACLPNYSVLGANSLLNKQYADPYCLYAGSPARRMKELPRTMKYFSRTVGFIE